MIVFPAIDILDGKAVRLRQGRLDAVTVYNDDPVDQAEAVQARGRRVGPRGRPRRRGARRAQEHRAS